MHVGDGAVHQVLQSPGSTSPRQLSLDAAQANHANHGWSTCVGLCQNTSRCGVKRGNWGPGQGDEGEHSGLDKVTHGNRLSWGMNRSIRPLTMIIWQTRGMNA